MATLPVRSPLGGTGSYPASRADSRIGGGRGAAAGSGHAGTLAVRGRWTHPMWSVSPGKRNFRRSAADGRAGGNRGRRMRPHPGPNKKQACPPR